MQTPFLLLSGLSFLNRKSLHFLRFPKDKTQNFSLLKSYFLSHTFKILETQSQIALTNFLPYLLSLPFATLLFLLYSHFHTKSHFYNNIYSNTFYVSFYIYKRLMVLFSNHVFVTIPIVCTNPSFKFPKATCQ